ncbi:SGNH/GDSL hydrolase family protein [Sphingobacterium spiritivorum]|uniref:SGNH/GDSL hydrolase family protein n=1 Tax=Sphingobacterium spiritivorum TaxID=258 RepID=UPI003DA46A40
MNTNRRSFISKSLLTVGAAVAGTSLLQARENKLSLPAKGNQISIKKNDIILFQGDSITDAGRQKDNPNPNETSAFGSGYALLAAGSLLSEHASKNIKIFNKGISGNRVPDLQKRWQRDTFDIKPTILSILIGVNDFWRTMDSGASNTAQQYKEQYQKLLDDTLKQLPNVQLIIGEPFGLKGVKHVTDAWYPAFEGYQQAARDVAKEFKATLIPYQSIFDKALAEAPGSYWTTDGVHTSLAGATLMAESWLNTIK